jgi:hypothetical protein
MTRFRVAKRFLDQYQIQEAERQGASRILDTSSGSCSLQCGPFGDIDVIAEFP